MLGVLGIEASCNLLGSEPVVPVHHLVGASAVTTGACAEFAARVDWPTAASRATVLNLSASTQPSPAFGAPGALPPGASRAARSASAVSFLSRSFVFANL